MKATESRENELRSKANIKPVKQQRQTQAQSGLWEGKGKGEPRVVSLYAEGQHAWPAVVMPGDVWADSASVSAVTAPLTS